MTLNDKALLDEIFQRFGSPSQEAQFQIHGYFQKAEAIDRPANIRSADESAARLIQEMSYKIEQLNAYRRALAERYSFLETAPTVPIVRLIRKRDYYSKKVYYHLCTFRRFVDSDTEIEESRSTYPGTERSAAIKDFRAYVKAHPGIISEMQMQKGRWEK